MVIRINKSAKGFKVIFTDSIEKVKHLLNLNDITYLKNMNSVRKQLIFYIYSVPTPFLLVYIPLDHLAVQSPKILRNIGHDLDIELFQLKQKDIKVMNFIENTTAIYLLFQGVILSSGANRHLQSISFEREQINGTQVAYLQALSDSQNLFLEGVNKSHFTNVDSFESHCKALGLNGLFRVQKVNAFRLQQGGYFKQWMQNRVDENFAFFQFSHRSAQSLNPETLIIGCVFDFEDANEKFWLALSILNFISVQNLPYNLQIHCLVCSEHKLFKNYCQLSNGNTIFASGKEFELALLLDWLLYLNKQGVDNQLITLFSGKRYDADSFNNQGVLFNLKMQLNYPLILSVFEKENELAWPLPNAWSRADESAFNTNYDFSRMTTLQMINLLGSYASTEKWINLAFPTCQKNIAFKSIPEGWFSMLRIVLENKIGLLKV